MSSTIIITNRDRAIVWANVSFKEIARNKSSPKWISKQHARIYPRDFFKSRYRERLNVQGCAKGLLNLFTVIQPLAKTQNPCFRPKVVQGWFLEKIVPYHYEGFLNRTRWTHFDQTIIKTKSLKSNWYSSNLKKCLAPKTELGVQIQKEFETTKRTTNERKQKSALRAFVSKISSKLNQLRNIKVSKNVHKFQNKWKSRMDGDKRLSLMRGSYKLDNSNHQIISSIKGNPIVVL